MGKKFKKDLEEHQDVRVAATSRIWGIAVGMLAICIPLSAVTKSGPILPLATLTGAAVGTAAVWRSDDKKSKSNSLPQQKVELLEQRIANLETIVSSEDFDLRMKIKQLELSDRAERNSQGHRQLDN
ncbi:hypothetical protein SAMD00079811_27670 [Scytonema sp. HK-05]|uniref:hypothetical protein n=1 Tax=Scytonema sp. HK-05 TaxID=1137095 RepID=UPI000936BD5A|nr:hypothetical protein [Scytonema sp. HK-05]OKH60854.1 hypothetical protein NIES2130_01880 [Scytonema sp. HK-05]BAY45165.1 hypothetical protein SAMD00079811_27670 [Scytonema sp. HK-05]